MSLSVAGISTFGSDAVSPISDHHPQKPVPEPTEAQEIETLASAGQSASQIATTLVVPLSDVDSSLNVATTSSASALLALTGRLDVHA